MGAGSAGRHGNGHGAATGGADSNGHGNGRLGSHGNAHNKLVPTHASIGASAVVRPVPGGEHKGMLKLVEFTQPASGTVSRNADQTLTYRPKPGFTGEESFDYTLLDEAGVTFSATVSVAVTLDAPAVGPAAMAPSSRKPHPLSAPPPANPGEDLPPLHGGPAQIPGE